MVGSQVLSGVGVVVVGAQGSTEAFEDEKSRACLPRVAG